MCLQLISLPRSLANAGIRVRLGRLEVSGPPGPFQRRRIGGQLVNCADANYADPGNCCAESWSMASGAANEVSTDRLCHRHSGLELCHV